MIEPDTQDRGGRVVPPHIAKPVFAAACRMPHERRMAKVKLAVWFGAQSLFGSALLRGGDLSTFLALILYGVSSAGVGIILLRLLGRFTAPRFVARWGVERKRKGVE